MVVEEVKIGDIEFLITECYKNDDELLKKHHVIAPTTLERASDHTSKTLVKDIEEKNLIVYKIMDANEFSAYFGVYDKDNIQGLNGFFIIPKFRTKNFIEKFWEIVLDKFDEKCYIALYKKNIKGIAFIQKKSFKFVRNIFDATENQEAYLYVLNK